MKSLTNTNLKNKKVLFRVAYDISLDKKNGKYVVTDNTRITATLKTLKYLLNNNCSVVVMSWLGRPGGKVDKKYSLAPVANELARLIKKPVKLTNSCQGKTTTQQVKDLQPGEILMLENVRFCKDEDNKNFKASKGFVFDCDIIVFDAFAQAHRDVPSVIGILKYIPVVAGFLVEKEKHALNQIIQKPKKPYVVIVGGAKIDDKIEYVKSFLKKADKVLLGGGLANTFLKAQGIQVGKSKINSGGKGIVKRERDFDVVKQAVSLLRKYKSKIVLPVDFVVASDISQTAKTKIYKIGDELKPSWRLLDIGPETIELFSNEIKKAKSVFWNGPVGVFEIDKFSKGTKGVALAMAKNKQAFTVIGGGDTEKAISKFKLGSKYSHISTGGGASLEYVSSGNLPVFKILK